jgi:AcrR family transcriptional regulator
MTETKGQATKHHILREGLMLASVKGLVNISIGGLAAKAEMSRSGLFAHFLSKEQLQLEILEFADSLFKEVVLNPCQQLESPREKVQFLVNKMPGWYENTEPKIPGGCIFLTACLEFDDRPGRVKDFLLDQQKAFLNFLEEVHKEGVERGEFTGTLSDEDFAFVFYSFYMGFNQYKKFFGDADAKKHADKHLNGLIDYAANTPLIN